MQVKGLRPSWRTVCIPVVYITLMPQSLIMAMTTLCQGWFSVLVCGVMLVCSCIFWVARHCKSRISKVCYVVFELYILRSRSHAECCNSWLRSGEKGVSFTLQLRSRWQWLCVCRCATTIEWTSSMDPVGVKAGYRCTHVLCYGTGGRCCCALTRVVLSSATT